MTYGMAIVLCFVFGGVVYSCFTLQEILSELKKGRDK
jgi:hypothetical protein